MTKGRKKLGKLGPQFHHIHGCHHANAAVERPGTGEVFQYSSPVIQFVR